MKSLNSLIIATSNNKLGDTTNKTGVWLEDLATTYFLLKEGGEFITIASPLGGQIRLDPNSESTSAITESTILFHKDSQAMFHFSHSLPLNEIKAKNFDLVFLVGGYGAMWDFYNNKCLEKLLQDFNSQNKPIGLIGHAVVALISLKNDNGELLIKGRKLTAFGNSEEESARLNEKPPFLLESELLSLGALYTKGPDFGSYVVADDNIITGQNPSSSFETVKQVLAFAYRKRELLYCI
jgi:putative intracellular protease/amidase